MDVVTTQNQFIQVMPLRRRTFANRLLLRPPFASILLHLAIIPFSDGSNSKSNEIWDGGSDSEDMVIGVVVRSSAIALMTVALATRALCSRFMFTIPIYSKHAMSRQNSFRLQLRTHHFWFRMQLYNISNHIILNIYNSTGSRWQSAKSQQQQFQTHLPQMILAFIWLPSLATLK